MPKSKYKKAIKKASGVVAPTANWVTRLMKMVKQTLAEERAKAPLETTRTKAIKGGLKDAGLTDTEIKKFQRKR